MSRRVSKDVVKGDLAGRRWPSRPLCRFLALGLGVAAVPLSLSPSFAGKEVVLEPAHTYVEDDGVVERALRDELGRSLKDLHLPEQPKPYYLAYALADTSQALVSATYGAVTTLSDYRGRSLRTDLRVGDASFDNANFSDGFSGGGQVAALPVDDDYAALRRELWLRTDEAFKDALETYARKKAAVSQNVENTEDKEPVPDFAPAKPVDLRLVPPRVRPATEQLRGVVETLARLFRGFPKLSSSRVTATLTEVRRRFVSSEGTFTDETKTIVKLDVLGETQAADGMRLRSFVAFNAPSPDKLPALAEMEKAVTRMATELGALREAPVADNAAATVLFEGPAAAQLVKLLLAGELGGTPPAKSPNGGEERSQTSQFADRLGQRVVSPLLDIVDDPLQETAGPAHQHLFGAYRADDEGVPAARVALVDHGILKSLLMTRTPRREIRASNGHARAPRFAGPRAAPGSLFVTSSTTKSRTELLNEMARLAKGGGVQSYVVKLLDDGTNPSDGDDTVSFFVSSQGPAPLRPLVAYRVVKGADGKLREEPVRGLTLEGMLPRSFKDLVAVGKEPTVYNFFDSGSSGSGIPTTIVAPPLLISDVDIRKSPGKSRRPPLYPNPMFMGPGAAKAEATGPAKPGSP